MLLTLFKLGVSASMIAFASWLSGKKPELAGFIIALPLLTLLVLPFSYIEYQDPAASVRFAKSIFTAVIPVLFRPIPVRGADRFGVLGVVPVGGGAAGGGLFRTSGDYERLGLNPSVMMIVLMHLRMGGIDPGQDRNDDKGRQIPQKDNRRDP